MRYLTNWRMQAAMQKLRETRLMVAQIAFEVGYESEASFTRAFRRETGLPPAAWRAEYAPP
jgi:AraC-like DNA-binding protein